ncbi:MAG: dTDP-4-dehydrorhamnose reductase [Magnetospiraceae bacterium]
MKVLIFGADGQLGSELLRKPWPAGLTRIGLMIGDCDITDEAAVRGAFEEHRPDLVVNAAAYTAVDKAEEDIDIAFRVNAGGVRFLARYAASALIPLVHVSTDYVFDGTKEGAYLEDDPVKPIGIYGESKEAGEKAVRELIAAHVILRTAWVYSPFGNNFVKTMLRVGAQRPELRVVNDQQGCPTAAGDLATTIIDIAGKILQEGATPWGTYHYCGATATTWHGLAEAVFGLSDLNPKPVVQPIPTHEYPTPAKRPANSVLDCTKITRDLGITPRPMADSLAEVMADLKQMEG